MNPLALTPKQAAELTPYGENKIRLLANTDPTFPAFKNGSDIIIPTKAFEDWLVVQAAHRLGFDTYNNTHPALLEKKRRRGVAK